jgi:hypothetical protein
MIAVLQAAKEGKEIQRRLKQQVEYGWEKVSFVDPLFGVYDYRVKPEPDSPHAVLNFPQCK